MAPMGGTTVTAWELDIDGVGWQLDGSGVVLQRRQATKGANGVEGEAGEHNNYLLRLGDHGHALGSRRSD